LLMYQVDHDKLHSVISPIYKDIKSINQKITILTLRLANGDVIYRAHKPDFYGDPLGNKRGMIASTNQNRKSFRGFDVSKFGVIYSVTKPIFYKDSYIGSAEIGISIDSFIKSLTTVFDLEVGVAVKKDFLDTLLDKNSLDINEQLSLISVNESLKNYFDKENRYKFSNLKVDMEIPFLSYKSDTVGFLVLGYDSSKIVTNNENFLYKLFFIGVVITAVLVFILHSAFNSILRYSTGQLYTDQLTGLKNRQALLDDINSNEKNILILSNIKEFSLLNEFYGIDIANSVLQQVGKEISRFAKENNLKVYRVSSDEYVLLTHDISFDVMECHDVLDELHEVISRFDIYVDKNEEPLSVEIYSGVSFNGEHPLEEAQIALKESKVKAVSYLAYTQHLDTKINTKKTIGMKKIIRHAIEHNNVIPFFQPITNRYGEFIKYESLIRILDFENGNEKIIYPDQFLLIAIKSGLYVDLAKEMLTQTLTFFKNRDEKISVNLLPNDFYNHVIMDRFIELIQEYEHPEKIVVEITEQEGVGDFNRLFKIVKKLRKLGVGIAIDDFGSGYANYVHILKLKPDYLKIDGSLIKNILTDEDSQILVKSITRFAGYMKIKTIAEYVENEEIFELLKQYGVDEFQGYYFGRPLNLISNQSQIFI
ncbi:MAG: EAL domain-containing protein, partial [Campylobacterales bacterium]|nr:EAL domain-containing protein [Campylobacterales bacterium]